MAATGKAPVFIFGREPALYVSLAATAIRLLSAFWIDLNADQQSALNAVVAAISGAAIAFVVRDGQVPAILGVASALIALALGFGLNIDPDDQAVIMSAVGTIGAMFTRTQVTAPVPPTA